MRTMFAVLISSPGRNEWITTSKVMHATRVDAHSAAYTNAMRILTSKVGVPEEEAIVYTTQWRQDLLAAGPDTVCTLKEPITGEPVLDYVLATIAFPNIPTPLSTQEVQA